MHQERLKKGEQNSTRVLDYSATLSEYERKSLAAEPKLNAEREKKKLPKPRKA